jgi:hypothetical protein
LRVWSAVALGGILGAAGGTDGETRFDRSGSDSDDGAGLLAQGETASDGVVAAHRKFVDAYKTCNTGSMNTLVTDDMQFIHVGGNIQNREQFIKGVGACALTDMRSDIMNVRMYGDTGIVTGKFNYKTKTGGGTLLFTEVYIRRGGRWMFANHQSTEPAAPHPASAGTK